MKRSFVAALAALSLGCLLDSVEPWLSPETIVGFRVEVDGKWSVVDEVELFGGETKVSLERKPATARSKEFFYIKIRPLRRDTQFVFRGTVHEIGGLQFLQISNFTHFDDEIFGLANRPTYSLWRVEADDNNIMIWAPDLSFGTHGRLKTIQDQDDTPLFVDTASNNEGAIREWVRAYRSKAERPKRVLGLALTRAGTDFEMPAAAEPHLPPTAEWKKRQSRE